MVKIAVFNLAGQVVEVLVDMWRPAGEYSVAWVPENCASGIYVVRLIQGSRSAAVKVLYMK